MLFNIAVSCADFVAFDVLGPFEDPAILSLAEADEVILVDLRALQQSKLLDSAL